MIHTEQLTRRFELGDEVVEAVRGIDLDVEAGEMVAVLGPNGAGKSTTIRMLTTLLAPSAGTAVVAGHDVARDPTAVRRRIGVVGQGNGSFDGLRVHEELEGQARLHGLGRREARARTAELLDELDLGPQAGRDVARLSGGQRRRLDVAMGLVHRPELAFLDEPTASLDPQSRANLWEHVRRMRAADGTTVLLTTHYLDEADQTAERIVVVDRGEIIAEGTPDELKGRTVGDRVAIELAADQVPAAVRAARAVRGVADVHDGDGLLVDVASADAAMPELVRALDAADVRVSAIRSLRPSLDDVFLTLTGRSLRDAG